MTIDSLRRQVKKTYRIGQKITLHTKDNDRHGGIRFTVRILEFYPHYVLTTRKGYKLCFRYYDILRMTNSIYEEEIEEDKAGWHHSKSVS
jgi:hypothetical protein